MAYRAQSAKTLAKRLTDLAKQIVDSEIDENYRTNIDMTIRMLEQEAATGTENSRHTKGRLKELAAEEKARNQAAREKAAKAKARNDISRAVRAQSKKGK